MEKFYEKLRGMTPNKAKWFELITGFVTGCITWGAIIFTSQLTDKLLGISFLVVFVLAMVFQSKVRTNVGWPMTRFRFAMIAGLGLGIIIHLIYGLATGMI